MARPDKRKVNVAPRASAPLLSGAFSALDALDSALLAPSPEPEPPPPAPAPPARSAEAAAPAKPKNPGPSLIGTLQGYPENSRGRLVLRRETKGRGGKTVVVITGFRELPEFTAVAMGDLSKNLRSRLGCGGSFDRTEIVLQGDRPEDVTTLLRHLGFRVEGVTTRPS